MKIDAARTREFLWAAAIVLSVLAGCRDNGLQPPIENPIPTDEGPSWSSDGQWIAYTHVSVIVYDTTYPTGLYVVDTAGNNQRLVIKGFAYNPAWSPDGKSILHCRYLIGVETSELFIMDTSGGHPIRLTYDSLEDRYPAWSRDGSSIAWTVLNQGLTEIWMMKADGSSQRKLTNGLYSSWSPDSKRIVFSNISTEKDRTVLWIINLNGNGIKQLTH